MTDQNNTAPAVWDPTARGGAGGWVRGTPGTAPPAGTDEPAARPPARQGPPGPSPAPPQGPGASAPALRPPQPHSGPPAQPARPGPTPEGQGPPAPRPYVARPPAPSQGPARGPGPFQAPDEDAVETRVVPVVPSAAPGGYGHPPAPQQQAQQQTPYQQSRQPQQPQPYPPQGGPAAQGFPGHAAGQAPFPSHTAPAGPPPGGFAQSPPQSPFPPGPYPPQERYAPDRYSQEPYPQGPYPPAGAPSDQGGRYEPNRYAEEEQRPRRNRKPLFVALGLLLVLGIGGGAVWAVQNSTGGSPKAGPAPAASTAGGHQPAPLPSGSDSTGSASASPAASASPSASASAGANAEAQAKALDELLGRAETAKSPIGSAVAKVSSCPAKADIESAAQVFDTGAKQRDQLLADLAKLDVGDVPGGADAVQALKTAWQQSGDIDRAYATWARSVAAKGCSGTAPSTPDKKRADELNPQATQSKKDFVTKWKPTADTYGLAQRTWDRI